MISPILILGSFLASVRGGIRCSGAAGEGRKLVKSTAHRFLKRSDGCSPNIDKLFFVTFLYLFNMESQN
uniref:Secreted protein n=1 Tax=Triticum urartu TaxID=4572 RepID=A0A8R7PNF4_TRIUA